MDTCSDFSACWRRPADDQVQFQGTTLEGFLDGFHKRAAATRTGSFEATKAKAIGLCLNGLKDRFGNLFIDQTSGDEPSSNSTADVVRDTLVFNVDAWPTNPQDLVVFGNEQIERLAHWFEPVLANAGCQVVAIPDEWLSMKVQINTSFRDKDYGSLWQSLLTKMSYHQDFQNILHLVEIRWYYRFCGETQRNIFIRDFNIDWLNKTQRTSLYNLFVANHNWYHFILHTAKLVVIISTHVFLNQKYNFLFGNICYSDHKEISALINCF